jgi:hypothetical protein
MENPRYYGEGKGGYNFSFDASDRPFAFEHLEPRGRTWNDSEAFLRRGLSRFVGDVCPPCSLAAAATNSSSVTRHRVDVREFWNIGANCSRQQRAEGTVFEIDNMWKMSADVDCGDVEVPWSRRFREQLSVVGRLLASELPAANDGGGGDLPATTTTAVHIRLGDAARRNGWWPSGPLFRALRLVHRYAVRRGLPVVIDTDDAEWVIRMLKCTSGGRWGIGYLPPFVATSPLFAALCDRGSVPENVRVHGGEESVLDALRRFVLADRFVGAPSSLSMAAAMMRGGGDSSDNEKETYVPREYLRGKCKLYPTHIRAY